MATASLSKRSGRSALRSRLATTLAVEIVEVLSNRLLNVYNAREEGYEPSSFDQISVYVEKELYDKDIYINGNLNKSKGKIVKIFEQLGCLLMEIKVTEGIVQVGDSGALIYDAQGLAIAIVKGVSADDVAIATLLSELRVNFVVP